MKTKKLIVTLCLMLGLILALNTNVFALQSTSATVISKSDRPANWVTNIRKIEGENGGMGLKETINTNNALATSESNNIDVHLQKNTEYGAMVLLGASNYGKRATNASASATYMHSGGTNKTGTATTLATSTGNISGVYELGYYNMSTANNGLYEWTAGGGTSFFSGVDSRYRNTYTTSNVGIAGDATIDNSVDLSKWHCGSAASFWATGSNGFMRGRGGSGGVFSRLDNSASISGYARAAVVCGAGL